MSTLKVEATPFVDGSDADQPSESGTLSFIAISPAMRKLFDRAQVVAPHLRIAAIEGESGTGKHTLARLLYQRCAARRPEIFQRGFTRCDARDWLLAQTHPQALAGFIYLDRVDLLPAPAQALLLRILKDLDFRHPGALVVLASAECSLRELARKDQFLTELAVRFSSVRLAVPPLRERKEEIIPVAGVFLDRIAARYSIPPVILTSGAIGRLLEYDWPGNLRELSSILESAVIEGSGGMIRCEDLPLPDNKLPAPATARNPGVLNLDAAIHDHIVRVLELNEGNKLRTARQLGISRSTLYRLLEKRLTFSG